MCWVQEANGIMIQGGIAEVHTLRGKNLAASEFSDCPSVFFFSFGSFPVPGIVREKGITELSLPAQFSLDKGRTRGSSFTRFWQTSLS